MFIVPTQKQQNTRGLMLWILNKLQVLLKKILGNILVKQENGFNMELKIEKQENLLETVLLNLTNTEIRIAEIGISISHLEQRKGYAKEALLGILAFLFDWKEIHRVVEIVDAENIASINLLKSTGFQEEGHFIVNIFFKGKWGSEFQYAMLKREWDTNTKYGCQDKTTNR